MTAGTSKRTTWKGGLVRYGKDGRTVYVIREQVNGRRWTITLRERDEERAEAELALFRKDPVLYARRLERERTDGVAQPVRLDDATKLEFLEWTRDEMRRSDGYCHDLKIYLGWWQERIGEVDLRCQGLTLERLRNALDGCTARLQRTAAIKRFLSYLRKQGKITAADDPTLFGALPVPKSKPAQRSDKANVPRASVAAVLERLRNGEGNMPVYADMLLLQAGTGWHTTEVFRFMEYGTFAPLPGRQKATPVEAGIIVCAHRKGGQEERNVRVSAEVLTAAKRLRLHGLFKDDRGERRKDRSVRDSYDQAIARACKSAKVPVFSGAQMRHANATWAIEHGEDPAIVAAYLGHKDRRTTRRFYARHAAVRKVTTLF